MSNWKWTWLHCRWRMLEASYIEDIFEILDSVSNIVKQSPCKSHQKHFSQSFWNSIVLIKNIESNDCNHDWFSNSDVINLQSIKDLLTAFPHQNFHMIDQILVLLVCDSSCNILDAICQHDNSYIQHPSDILEGTFLDFKSNWILNGPIFCCW